MTAIVAVVLVDVAEVPFGTVVADAKAIVRSWFVYTGLVPSPLSIGVAVVVFRHGSSDFNGWCSIPGPIVVVAVPNLTPHARFEMR